MQSIVIRGREVDADLRTAKPCDCGDCPICDDQDAEALGIEAELRAAMAPKTPPDLGCYTGESPACGECPACEAEIRWFADHPDYTSKDQDQAIGLDDALAGRPKRIFGLLDRTRPWDYLLGYTEGLKIVRGRLLEAVLLAGEWSGWEGRAGVVPNQWRDDAELVAAWTWGYRQGAVDRDRDEEEILERERLMAQVWGEGARHGDA